MFSAQQKQLVENRPKLVMGLVVFLKLITFTIKYLDLSHFALLHKKLQLQTF